MTQATRATLYLGANIGGKHGVGGNAFHDFLADYVVPLFPGFTVHDGIGYWKGEPEQVRELIILREDDDAKFHWDVESIARAYKRKFRQESVMISYEPVTVQFDVPDLAFKINDMTGGMP